MEPVLETLPDHPLTVEDVAVLNDAPSLRVIPFTWYGEQVIAILLLYDERRADLESGLQADAEDGAYTKSDESGAGDGAEDGTDGFAKERTDGSAEENTGGFAEESTDGSVEESMEGSAEESSNGFSAPDEAATQVEIIDATGEGTAGSGSTRQSETAESEGNETDTGTDRNAAGESPFGSRDADRVGTVELVGVDGGDAGTDPAESEQSAPAVRADDGKSVDSDPEGAASGPSDEESSRRDQVPEDDGDDPALKVYAAGYDDAQQAWVVAGQVDPDAELTAAEPIVREWLTETYADGIVSRLAVGPSEYELADDEEK